MFWILTLLVITVPRYPDGFHGPKVDPVEVSGTYPDELTCRRAGAALSRAAIKAADSDTQIYAVCTTHELEK
jgi:hypothetical protein